MRRVPDTKGNIIVRKKTQLSLRLSLHDAERLRRLAEASGQGIAEVVVAMMDGGDIEIVPEAVLADNAAIREIAAARLALDNARAELGAARSRYASGFGLLKHLFEAPSSALAAEQHYAELSNAVRDARALIKRAEMALDQWTVMSEAAVGELRAAVRATLAQHAR